MEKSWSDFWSNIRFSCADARSHFTAYAEELFLRLDKRTSQDVYPGYCEIHVMVPTTKEGAFRLELRNPPLTGEVEKFLAANNAQIRHAVQTTTITLQLTVSSGPEVLNKLARVIRRVTRRKQQYADRNWKWICPRTAEALERFASALAWVSRPR